jgi:hypothetical protein
LLDKVRDLVAPEIEADHIGFGLTNLQEIEAEIGHVGDDEFVPDQRCVWRRNLPVRRSTLEARSWPA